MLRFKRVGEQLGESDTITGGIVCAVAHTAVQGKNLVPSTLPQLSTVSSCMNLLAC